MENKKYTLNDFYNQILLKKIHKKNYLNAFLDYCNTFNITFFNDKFFDNPDDKTLKNERAIKKEMISYFQNSKKEILEYRYDYYTNKTVEDISVIIEKDVDRVVAYLERIKHTFQDDEITFLSAYGDVIPKTKVKHISSFKILNELQTIERQLLLSKLAKKRV